MSDGDGLRPTSKELAHAIGDKTVSPANAGSAADAAGQAANANGARRTGDVSAGACGDHTADAADASSVASDSMADKVSNGAKPSDSRSRAAPKAQKKKGQKFPTLLDELGLKLTSTGIVVPESQKMRRTRRREAREKGLLVYKEPLLEPAELAALEKKRKKKMQKPQSQGVVLDDIESDLFRAAFAGDCDACCEAIASGADANVCTNADYDGIGAGGTALHVAASRGHEGVVAVLLGAKADPTMVSGRNDTPLALATRGGHVQVVKVLCSAGVEPPDAEGTMRLMQRAPQWDHGRKRKELRVAMSGASPGVAKRMRQMLRDDTPRGVWATDADEGNSCQDMVKSEDEQEYADRGPSKADADGYQGESIQQGKGFRGRKAGGKGNKAGKKGGKGDGKTRRGRRKGHSDKGGAD